jgi:hypothetical protein
MRWDGVGVAPAVIAGDRQRNDPGQGPIGSGRVKDENETGHTPNNRYRGPGLLVACLQMRLRRASKPPVPSQARDRPGP